MRRLATRGGGGSTTVVCRNAWTTDRPFRVGTLLECRRNGRFLHNSNHVQAITPLKMPSLSPTMESGTIASWKVDLGQSFSAGDVILEVETDKATMDVEAQEDGVLAKIVLDKESGKIEVGKVIGMLAEEGDDISNVEVPEDEVPKKKAAKEAKAADTTKNTASTSESSKDTAGPSVESDLPRQAKEASEPSNRSAQSSKDKPEQHHHAMPSNLQLGPAVSMLIALKGLSPEKVSQIKGTGYHGRLTKGDILASLGEIASARGQAKLLIDHDAKKTKEEREKLRVDSKRDTSAEQQPLRLSEAGWRQRISDRMMKPEARADLVPDVTALQKKNEAVKKQQLEDDLWGTLLENAYVSKLPPGTPRSEPFKEIYDDIEWFAGKQKARPDPLSMPLVEGASAPVEETNRVEGVPSSLAQDAQYGVDDIIKAAAHGALVAMQHRSGPSAGSTSAMYGLSSSSHRPRARPEAVPLSTTQGQWQGSRSFHSTRQNSHGDIRPPEPGKGIHITFETADGQAKTIECNEGDNLLDLAHEHDVDLEGACEGSVACSTCHVILESWAYDDLEPETDEEADMLDLAFGLTDTSRLGCQIKVKKSLEGMKVKLPSMTRNMYVDGHKPKPH